MLDYFDDHTALLVALVLDTLSMMLSFFMILVTAEEISLGGSGLNVIWYVIFVFLTKWYIDAVRKDWDALS